MLEIYKLARQFFLRFRAVSHPFSSGRQSDTVHLAEDWLCELLATPERRLILVPCLQEKLIASKRRQLETEQRSEMPSDCHICIRLQLQGVVNDSQRTMELSLKRPSSNDNFTEQRRYHLVPITWTCWQKVILPDVADTTLPSGKCPIGDSSELEEPLPNKSFHQPQVDSLDVEQQISLYETYGSEWRSFFCDTLKTPPVSSLPEVLRLRPTPPPLDNPVTYPSFIKSFGRRLGSWYALLHYSILVSIDRLPESSDPSSHAISPKETELRRLIAEISQFPLLYDMFGRWRSPRDALSGNNGGHLLTWKDADLAKLFLRVNWPPGASCTLLGHSLSSMKAIATSPVNVFWDQDHSNNFVGSVVGRSDVLLSNILRLPDLENIASLEIGTGSSYPLANVAVEFPPLDTVTKGFRELAKLWLLRHSRSGPSSSGFLQSTSANTPEAFLVPELCLFFKLTKLSDSLSSSVGKILNIQCRFCDGKLYLDSCLRERLFPGIESDLQPKIILLKSALVSTFLQSVADDNTPISNVLLVELARVSSPSSHSSQLALMNFVQGFLDVISSMPVDLSSPLNRKPLRAYLLSHGVSRFQVEPFLNRLLDDYPDLRSPTVPPSLHTASPYQLQIASPLSSSVIEFRSSVPREPTEVACSANVAGASLQTRTDRTYAQYLLAQNSASQDVGADEGLTSSPHNFSMLQPGLTPGRIEALVSNTVRGTRYQTSLASAFFAGVSGNHYQSSDVCSQGDQQPPSSSVDSFWGHLAESSFQSSAMFARLEKLLTPGVHRNTSSLKEIGRLGEMTVYQYLQEAMNDDRGFLFPTGNERLGSGRIIDCTWTNGDSESRLPYDITITLRVECAQSNWNQVLQDMSSGINQHSVSVERNPLGNQPGVLRVGPILLEVKSTGFMDPGKALDLFELSLTEAVYADKAGWRYHLVRVHWIRSNIGDPQSPLVPQLTHIPNLADALRSNSSEVRLCVAFSKQ